MYSFSLRSSSTGVLLASLAALAASLAGCVTSTPTSKTPSSGAYLVEGVPIGDFGLERCGAGSLAGVLAKYDNYYAGEEAIEELEAALPKASNGGVLTLDLMLEARARGFAATLARGSAASVERLLEDGIPVILVLRILNMPGESKDLFHYVIADGWDASRDLLRLHFGDGEVRWTRRRWLSKPWGATGNAMITVEPRIEPSESTARDALRYAVALERDGNVQDAREIYQSLLKNQSESALLWTNLANANRALGDPEAAEWAYRRAIEIDASHQEALNNLAWLLLEMGVPPVESIALARRAVEADGPDPHLALHTLAVALVQTGTCDEAVHLASRARDLAPAGSAEKQTLTDEVVRLREDCD